MSTCTTERPPVFWRPQDRLPVPVMRFLRARLEMALAQPAHRSLLAWPTLLGAPGLRQAYPQGIPEGVLLEQAERMLRAYHVPDVAEAWQAARELLPDVAEQGPDGWMPHASWASHGEAVSLRSGVMMLALLGHPEDPDAYRLSAGVALFNSALFHESHDALEELWLASRGHLKRGIQGLILLTGGFYHQQVGHLPGMVALWEDALAALAPLDGVLETPWGQVGFLPALQAIEERLTWLEGNAHPADLSPLWDMGRPRWELKA